MHHQLALPVSKEHSIPVREGLLASPLSEVHRSGFEYR